MAESWGNNSPGDMQCEVTSATSLSVQMDETSHLGVANVFHAGGGVLLLFQATDG